MKRFKITVIKEGIGESVKMIDLRIDPEEIRFRDWVDHNILYDSLSDPAKEFFQGESEGLAPGEWVEVYNFLLGAIETFSDSSLRELKNISAKNHDDAIDTLLAAYAMILKGLTYTPQERSKFVHHGETYYLPTKGVQKYGDQILDDFGQALTVGEVVEAYQRSHVYNMPGPDGEPMKDRRYYTDLAVVASIARKKVDGKLEVPPTGVSEFSNFVTERMDLFADIPLPVASDACFFLANSLNRYFKTLMSQRRSRSRRPKTRRN